MDASVTIRTNHKPRPLLFPDELTPKESAYWRSLLSDTAMHDATFFRYKGEAYFLGDFELAPRDFPGWDGIQGQSYFSGLLIAWPVDGDGFRDADSVVVGYYYG